MYTKEAHKYFLILVLALHAPYTIVTKISFLQYWCLTLIVRCWIESSSILNATFFKTKSQIFSEQLANEIVNV